MMRTILDSVAFTIIFPPMLFGFLWAGTTYAHHVFKKRGRVWKPIGVENGLLGIFALIISFTMITSGNYVRERTDCIHEEADELALIFRTSKFYNDTLRTRVHSYLREFLRIQLTNRAPSISECATLIDSMEMNDRELDDFLVRKIKASSSASS